MVRGGWKNPRKHRDRLCIMAEMLEIAKGGSLKTPIMYKANLSSAQLDEYLALLLEIGLLKALSKGGITLYKTTAKGFQFIESYKEITALLDREIFINVKGLPWRSHSTHFRHNQRGEEVPRLNY